MAVKTGEIFNSLVFGGVNSADYGIYITGEGVFNAPKRSVNMVAVPGRNGSIAIDQGHWENIEVTYPAGTFGMDEQEFRTALSDFRNAIASQVGYQRLTDTYHPDEYRMAIYMEGLEVEPTTYNKAGEFDLKFDCKPQRWLTSGEVPVTIGEWGATKEASGEIVTIESEGGEAAKSLVVTLEPIQSGSGDPSPDNVRPISGRTSVETTRTGKNLFEASTSGGRTNSGITWTYNSDGSLTASGTATGNSWSYGTAPSVTLPSGTYTVSVSSPFSLVIRKSDNTNIYNGDNSTHTFTLSEPTEIFIYARIKTGTTVNNATTGIMLEVGSSASEWQPYNGQTYTTALGRTVYGGTLDVVSGVLTVDRAMVTFDGSESWSGSVANLYYVQLDSMAKLTDYRPAILCDKMPAYERNGSVLVNAQIGITGYVDSQGRYPNQNWIYLQNRDCANVSALKTWLASNPLQVVYKLATPQTYQLTPQQIELLVGENHLWSDGAITMQYGDDPNSLWNPTQYDAGPLLAVKGHGDVSFNGYTVAIDAGEYGVINVKGKQTSTNPITYATDVSLYNDGDTIYVFVECDWVLTTLRNIYARSYSNQHDTGVGQTVMEPRSTSGNNRAVGTTIINSWFLSSQDETLTNTFSFDSLLSNGTTVTVSVIVEVTWDATNKTLSVSSSVPHASGWGGSHRTFPTITIEAASTKTYLGDPTLVDCELGEAYKVEDGEIISLNKYIELGSDLPKLSPGANDVTTDNTITELKVIPNWWKL